MGALNALLPVVTLVLGYFGTLVTEGRRDRRAARTAEHEREMAAQEQRAADRQAAVRRRESFEWRHSTECSSSWLIWGARLAKSMLKIFRAHAQRRVRIASRSG